MLTGWTGPFANAPPNIEMQVHFINGLIQRTEGLRAAGQYAVIEAVPEAEADWSQYCNDLAQATLFPSIPSWIFANVPGSSGPIPRFFLGGVANFTSILNRVVQADYDGFASPVGNGRKAVRDSSPKSTVQEKVAAKAIGVEITFA